MSKRNFKDQGLQKIYDRYRGYNQQFDVNRVGRNPLEDAYRRGYLDPSRQTQIRGSLAYAAWAAGVDDVRSKTT